MSFDNTIDFKDHIVQYPNRFKQTTVAPGVVELVPTWITNSDEVIEPGTPVDSELFKKLKQNVTIYQQTLTATEGQTIINLARSYLVGQNRVSLYVGGVKQYSGQDYTETNPTRLTMNTPLKGGYKVEVIMFTASQALAEDFFKKTTAAIEATLAANEAALGANAAKETAYTVHLTPVADFAAIATTYPSAVDGAEVQTLNDGKIYRKESGTWNYRKELTPGPVSELLFKMEAQKYYVNAKEYGAVGNGIANDTVAIQSAMNYCATNRKKLLIPYSASSYRISSLSIPSNLDVTFDSNGVIFEAVTGLTENQKLLNFDGASNVIFRCNNAIFKMKKTEYTTGESRHAISLTNCDNVTIEDAVAMDTGGDCFYIGSNVSNIKLIRPRALNPRRNGITLVSGINVNIESPYCKGALGINPESGIDIEPNSTTDIFKNVVITNAVCEDNNQTGVLLFFRKYGLVSPGPNSCEITFLNPVTRNNKKDGFRINRLETQTLVEGFVKVTNLLSENDGNSGLSIIDKSNLFSLLQVINPTILNPCKLKTTYPTERAVTITRGNINNVGQIDLSGLIVQDNLANSSYGLDLNMGTAENVAVSIKSIKGSNSGAVSTPISNGETVSSSVSIDKRMLRNEKSFTANTTGIYGNQFGEILTNEGATNLVRLTLREHIPIGSYYTFRVKSTQVLRISPYVTGEKIAGANAALKGIESSLVGSEMELYYYGNGLWVPVIKSGVWTFEV